MKLDFKLDLQVVKQQIDMLNCIFMEIIMKAFSVCIYKS